MKLCSKASLKKSFLYKGRTAIPQEVLTDNMTQNDSIAVRAYFKPIVIRNVKGKRMTSQIVRGYIFIMLDNGNGRAHYDPLKEIYISNISRKKFLSLARNISDNINGKLFRTLKN